MDKQLINTISTHVSQGDFVNAISLFKTAELAYKNDAQYWELLALTHGMSGNNEECMNACLRAIELNPDNIGTYINLGVSQQNLGLLDETEVTLKTALAMNSEHPQVQNNLGALYILQSDFNKAKPYVERALSINPDYSDAHCNLGEIYKNLHDNDKAIQSFLKAIELNINSVNAYVGLGTLYNFTGEFEKAEKYLSKAIELNPNHIEAIFNLGFLHYLKKSYDIAAEYFKRTIELDSNHHNAGYLLSAVSGIDAPEQSPALYVKGLFNHYADTFDEHLVNTLSYSVPETMHALFTDTAQLLKNEHMLDLGCGTGMCGEKFHTTFKFLTGIDLSENMVEKAKERNIYNELHCIDISDFLENDAKRYDLVVAADVFIYIGNITKLIKKIYSHQDTKGYFIFSIEKSSNHEGFHLQDTGRYSHSEGYISTILKGSNYNIVATQETIIRNEKGNNIDGVIYLCQK